MPPGGGGPGGSRKAVKLSGAFTVDGTTQTVANKTITSDAEDVSGVYVLNGGDLILSNVTVTTTGNPSFLSAISIAVFRLTARRPG